MSIYNTFIESLPNDNLKEVCHVLHNEIMKFPHIEMKEKFKLPFFYGKTWVCYLNSIKKTKKIVGIELVFVRAKEIRSKELLNFKNRVMAAGLTYRSVEDIDLGMLKLILEEAIELDYNIPYTFVKRKKK